MISIALLDFFIEPSDQAKIEEFRDAKNLGRETISSAIGFNVCKFLIYCNIFGAVAVGVFPKKKTNKKEYI